MAANEPTTLQEAILYYSNLDVCQKALVEARWPNGVTCPTCGRTDVVYLTNQKRWQCKSVHAKRQFSAKVGTIFEDSPIGLDKWFVAIWLIANAKNGISSYELMRSIGLKTQKSAWFVLHRIRLAMQAGGFEKKLMGHVEADETFIGGRGRFMHKDRKARALKGRQSGVFGKIVVAGLLERGKDGTSQVRTSVVRNTRRFGLQSQIRQHVVMDGTATIISDSLKSYERTPKYGPYYNYMHQVIDHAKSYVDGEIHTNGMENYWSLLKRTIKGTYVSVEPFHLFRYLDEQAYRFNSRKLTDGARFSEMMRRVTGKRLTYSDLIGKRFEQSI